VKSSQDKSRRVEESLDKSLEERHTIHTFDTHTRFREKYNGNAAHRTETKGDTKQFAKRIKVKREEANRMEVERNKTERKVEKVRKVRRERSVQGRRWSLRSDKKNGSYQQAYRKEKERKIKKQQKEYDSCVPPYPLHFPPFRFP
jgi:hypothetical protein